MRGAILAHGVENGGREGVGGGASGAGRVWVTTLRASPSRTPAWGSSGSNSHRSSGRTHPSVAPRSVGIAGHPVHMRPCWSPTRSHPGNSAPTRLPATAPPLGSGSASRSPFVFPSISAYSRLRPAPLPLPRLLVSSVQLRRLVSRHRSLTIRLFRVPTVTLSLYLVSKSIITYVCKSSPVTPILVVPFSYLHTYVMA